MIRIGVVGYGYWGPNLVRNFAETEDAEVVAVCDVNPERLAQARKRYPAVTVTPDPGELIDSPDVDAVVIATPVSTHFRLAMRALRAQKHVLVEKPVTTSTAEALRLVEEAARRNLTLGVDHTFLYTPAVRKIRELREKDDLGEIYYYDAVRVNLGLFQRDVNVIWDLAVHDLSIMDYLLPESPCAVSATGVSHFPDRGENIAYLTMFFSSKLIAHIHVNWLAPVKVRQTRIGGSRKMVVYDDIEASEKVKLYDKGITMQDDPGDYQARISYRSGDVWIPHLSTREALSTEAADFVRCVMTGAAPASDGQTGVRIVSMLEAAEQSMKEHGRPVEIAASMPKQEQYQWSRLSI